MPGLTIPETLQILENGETTLKGEFPWGSNYTFLVELQHNGSQILAVYKPTRGEQPLWDFPAASLAKREAAAFQVSNALKWELVPPTVYREDVPLGPGSLQVFIEHDPEYHYFNFSQQDKQRLRPTALFDLLVNNADRKGSHVLIDQTGHLWLIDHGICFHVEDKLRTVVWDFAGESFPTELVKDLQTFQISLQPTSKLRHKLLKLLSEEELQALAQRAAYLVTNPRYPDPNPDRRPYPWPLI